MAYEFSPDKDVGPPTSDGEGGQVIEFALGFNPDEDLIVLMAVLLTATDRADALELHFGIRTRINDGTASEPDYTKESVQRYIPKESRNLVTGLIRECVEKIVRASAPEFILMETFYPNLEPVALAKYAPVCEAVITGGYKVADSWRDQSNGKNYWIFRKDD
jgi:hypothetical protein